MDSTSTSSQLPTCSIHNMLANLTQPTDKSDFHEIIDFISGSYIHYSLTVSPRLSKGYINEFWVNASIRDEQGQRQIISRVAETEVVITEASIRSSLKFNDAEGITFLDDQILYENLRLMGYEGDYTKFTFKKGLFSPQWKFLIHTILHCFSSKRSAFEQFSTSIAYAVVCLATGQKFNFSNMIFNGMLRNLEQPEAQKFLMYPRFVQLLLNEQIPNLPAQDTALLVSKHKPKVFSNMRRQVKNFSGRVTALFPTMLPAPSATEEVLPTTSEPTVAENVDIPTTSQPTTVGGTIRKQGTFQLTYSRAKRAKQQVSEAHAAQASQPMDSGPEQHVVYEELDDHSVRAASTASSPLAEQDRSNIFKTQTEATPEDDSTPVDDFGGPSTNKRGESADHARHDAEDHNANDSPKESYPEGDEARNNLDLTKMIDYVWSKFVEERKNRRAQSDLIITLQQQVTDLQKEITDLKKKVTELKKKVDDESDEAEENEPEVEGNVAVKEEETGDTTANKIKKLYTSRKKSIPVRRKKVETQKKHTSQPSLPPVKISEPAATSGLSKKNLPKIDPKDKGKGKLVEEPKTTKSMPAALIEHDLEYAQKLQAEIDADTNEEGLIKVEIEPGVWVLMTKAQVAEYDADMLDEQREDDIEHLVKAVARKRAEEARQKIAAKPPTPAQRKKSLIAKMKGGIPLNRLKQMSLEELQRMWDNDTFLNPAAKERKEQEERQKKYRK